MAAFQKTTNVFLRTWIDSKPVINWWFRSFSATTTTDGSCSGCHRLDSKDHPSNSDKTDSRIPLITPRLSQSLTKAGYGITGSHSAVKVCRWTKKQLQGKGGCYKHTFYGIESHRCMETSTFLACANRCVFCWRHHTHPVSRDFSRWTPDPPEALLDNCLRQFKAMIKPLKGLVGVTPERFDEATRPIHCALSLVGEPIVYPYINEFVELLHSRNLSSFLVTNGQHPDAIQALRVPVTQLYVSIDAPNPDALKKTGRPLFSDYWDRLMASLDALAGRSERTVARLTLVNKWNDSHVEGYATLIRRAQPDFIEVKAFTYPGPSPSILEAGLSIHNCPTERQVVRFSTRLAEILSSTKSLNDKDYLIASEHVPSNSVLLASCNFLCSKQHGAQRDKDLNQAEEEPQWKFWIDFPKFHAELLRNKHHVQSNSASGERTTTSSQNPLFHTRLASTYTAPTPKWALYGTAMGGFDPAFDTHSWITQRDKRRQHEAEKDQQDVTL